MLRAFFKSYWINAFTILAFMSISANVLADPPEDTLRAKVSLAVLEHDHENDEEAMDALFNIPGSSHYETWVTDKIHPYEFDIRKFQDTISIALIDSLSAFTMPVEGRLTSGFGHRRSRYHYGIDIDLNTGDSILAVFDGIVRIAQYSSTYGYVIVVRHYNGLETLYAHLSHMEVKPGDAVTAGDIIGLGGNTGRSTGSHLHFEVRYKGWAIDPHNIISFENNDLVASTIDLTPSTFKYLKEMKEAKYYSVRRGDTLSGIARKNGTSVSALCRLNRISTRTIIRPGQKLRVR